MYIILLIFKLSGHYVIFDVGLTNRVVSRSCFCQHMKQGGVLGECRHIQRNQTLLTHSVHPFLFIFLPVLLFLFSSLPQASSSSTAGMVFGQKALHSQRVLVFHSLPQALVLMWGRRKGAQPQSESKMEKNGVFFCVERDLLSEVEGRELQSRRQWMRGKYKTHKSKQPRRIHSHRSLMRPRKFGNFCNN